MAELDLTDDVGIDQVDAEQRLLDALRRRGKSQKASGGIELSELEEQRLIQRILDDATTAASEMQPFHSFRKQYMETWRGVPKENNFPFKNAANIQVPLTSVFVEQSKARIYKILLGDDRFVEFTSLDETVQQEELDELTNWFLWELKNVVGIENVLSDIIHDTHVDGIGLGSASYEVEERELVSIHDFPISPEETIENQMVVHLMELFSDEEKARVDSQVGVGIYKVAYTSTATGEEKIAKVTYSLQQDRLQARVEKCVVIKDGVTVDRFDSEDLLVKNSDPEIDKLPFFATQEWLSVADYLAGVEEGDYRDFGSASLASEIVARASDKTSTLQPRQKTQVANAEEGTNSEILNSWDFARRYVEIVRWEGLWAKGWVQGGPEEDVDALSRAIGVCVWMDVKARRVLKICRLEELNPAGGRTPVKFDFIVQPGRFFSIGLVEWLRHVQAETNAIHNQRLDAGLLSNVPFGFYEAMSGLTAPTLALEPGKMYPVKSAAGVVFPRLNFQPTWSFQEEATVRRYAQEQAGLTEASLGTFITKRASASEWAGTAQAGDLRTEFIARRMFESTKMLFQRIFLLYQRYARTGRVYQIAGEKGERVVKKISLDRLRSNVVVQLTGSIQRLSAQLERDVALNMLSLLLNELLINMGIVKPDTIYAALQKVVKASDYRGVPLHKPDSPPMSDPPEHEHKRMLLGQPTPPSPFENFNEHLTAHVRLASSPDIMQYMPDPMARQALARHIQETQTLQQAVMLLRQQQAAQATQMQGTMAEMGIQPNVDGSKNPGDNADPGTEEEGVMTPESGPPLQ